MLKKLLPYFSNSMIEEKDKKPEKKKKTKAEEKEPSSSAVVKPAAAKAVSKKIPADPIRLASSEVKKHPAARPQKQSETAAAAAEMKQKIRIKIRAYDNKVADSSIKQIVEIAERYGAEVVGPVPLPTEIRKYTVNRSTFVHKNAREQFEMRVHKRLLDIINPTAKAIDSLMNLNLPAGVDIEVKM